MRSTRTSTRLSPVPTAHAVPRMNMAMRSSSSAVQPLRTGMATRSSDKAAPMILPHQASASTLNTPSGDQGGSMLSRRLIYSRHSPRPQRLPQRTPSVISIKSDSTGSIPSMEELFEEIFPQLAPSPSNSVARFEKEIDSRLAKFTRNPHKGVTSLRDALHKIISNFAEESNKANGLLEKFIGIFEQEGVCCICTNYMQEPVILIACGHSFCASCIHRHFCEHLAVHGIGVPPRDGVELQAAIQVIEGRGEVPREIFVYSCPHCRTKVQEPPITGYQFKAILSDVKELLNDKFNSRNMLGAPSVVPSNGFEGLFVKEVLRKF